MKNISKMTMAVESPSIGTETKQETQLNVPWNVIVHDDPVNLTEYVTKMLMKIFGYNESKAEQMMMEVHQQGRSIVWTGGRERAELYVQQLHQAQLTASMEQSK